MNRRRAMLLVNTRSRWAGRSHADGVYCARLYLILIIVAVVSIVLVSVK